MYDACVPWPERPKGAKDKSRGPKGLQLEVGAQRAPKLLYFFICRFFILTFSHFLIFILTPITCLSYSCCDQKVPI